MDLEDQLRGDAAGASSARLSERLQTHDAGRRARSGSKRDAPAGDPYGELKTRVQRAVIAKLGPRLFGNVHAIERPAQAGDGRGHSGDRQGGDRRSRRPTASG